MPANVHSNGLLPVPLTSLIDRERELAQAKSLLLNRHIRLVTLTGAPGTGKSRLAVALGAALAPRFPDGVCFVPLGSLSRDSDLYRLAYRHVVEIFRAEGATNAKFVWSPAGSPGADAYYPGDDDVDYVGVTVLGDADWDAASGEATRSFVDVFGPRYTMVAGYGKPVIVAELGVSGTAERQADWLSQARASTPRFPLLRGLVYFNAVNPWPGTANISPDWRLSPDVLRAAVPVRSG